MAFLYNGIAASVSAVPYDAVREVMKMAKDPVCNMDVDEKKAPATAEYKGKTYYFCAPGCKRAFLQNPEKYLKSAK
jgi:YHS domain-containing protein